MIRTNFQPAASMSSRFKPTALSGLGALQYEKEGSSYVANDVATMGVFKQLQRLINDIVTHDLAMPGAMPIIAGGLSVDGKLGVKTFTAVSTYMKARPLAVLGVSSSPPTSLAALVQDVQFYISVLATATGVPLPSASGGVLGSDYQGSSYVPGGTPSTPPPPPPPKPDLNADRKKSGATVYVAGGLLALGAILLLGKFGSKVPKRKGYRGFRGCRGMACR